MFFITIVIPVVSLIVAFGALLYAKRQTQLARDLAAKQQEQEEEVDRWLVDHENAAAMIARVPPQMMVQLPKGVGLTNVYGTVFQSPALRRDIETYIVEPTHGGTRLTPRRPTELELRSRRLRETVGKVKEILERCEQNEPWLFYYFKG